VLSLSADTAVQILHLFEADRKKIRAMGRKAASSLAVHEFLQAHPLTKIGPAAKDLKLSIPTVTSALETLTKLKIAEESTGRQQLKFVLGQVERTSKHLPGRRAHRHSRS